MPEVLNVTARCPDCGAESAGEGLRCERCAAAAAAVGTSPAAPNTQAVQKLQETEEERQSLRARIGGTILYLCVSVASVYFSLPFFEQGDWWFGLMGFGLAVIALIGVKESLFPSEWKTE
jgi:UDP-N-acetylmuramyl pentapeptide phosphotransferase/UDP-N-acetylglucosamine-1-phosphate transferase